jgi:dTDP-4-dehydrorhamnose 3,5-epimerase
MIKDVVIKNLRSIADERGRVMEILRSDDEIFKKFGQAYITTAYPGVVKAWHYHKLQTDYFTCVCGMMKVVLYDNRPDSSTKGEVNEFFIGEHHPVLLVIPKMVYHGFKCVGEKEAIIINIPSEPYNHANPDEFRLSYNSKEIPYNWEIQFK